MLSKTDDLYLIKPISRRQFTLLSRLQTPKGPIMRNEFGSSGGHLNQNFRATASIEQPNRIAGNRQ
jgi:hypothetical protein